jgi:hypothetical protein
VGSTDPTVPALVTCHDLAAGRDDQSAEAGSLPAGVAVDRRRPGRPATVSPHLLPLLRSPAGFAVLPATPMVQAEDRPRTPLVGIFNAILISSILWCLIAFAARAFVT